MTKTITPEPREGNPPVRIAETDAGMLNSIGLANPGRERFLAETLPRLRELGVPLWISVGGFCGAASYAETCARARGRRGDRAEPLLPERRRGARSRQRRSSPPAAPRRALPLYAKLSPAAWDIAEVARAVEAAGADGLSLVNTLRGLALDERTLRPMLGRGTGGYSGPALKPVALAAVYACSAAVDAAARRHGRSADSGLDALELIAGGCERGRTRHDPLLRPRRAGPDRLGARRRSSSPRTRTPPGREARSLMHPCK